MIHRSIEKSADGQRQGGWDGKQDAPLYFSFLTPQSVERNWPQVWRLEPKWWARIRGGVAWFAAWLQTVICPSTPRVWHVRTIAILLLSESEPPQSQKYHVWYWHDFIVGKSCNSQWERPRSVATVCRVLLRCRYRLFTHIPFRLVVFFGPKHKTSQISQQRTQIICVFLLKSRLIPPSIFEISWPLWNRYCEQQVCGPTFWTNRLVWVSGGLFCENCPLMSRGLHVLLKSVGAR